MKPMREMNRLLMDAISNVMTDAQLDAPLRTGGTTRDLVRESAMVYTNICPTEDAVESKTSAKTGRIKAYWHPHGYISPTKLNGEWLPLVLDMPEYP